MEPNVILAILDGITDPRNAGRLTRLDYANANAALQALQQHFQGLENAKPALPPKDPVPEPASP